MVDYENPWIFEGQPFLSENIGDKFGFVTSLQIYKTIDSTSVENTSGSLELQEVKNEK